MRDVPNSACEKLTTALILILIFWQTISPQKNATKSVTLGFQNCWMFPAIIASDVGFASDKVNDLYINLTTGGMIAIDIKTGRKRWETELGGDVIPVPVINSDSIYTAARYIGGQSKNIFQNENKNESTILRALDKTTGVTRWETKLEAVDQLYLSIFKNYIISVGDNGQIDAVDKIDGKIVWRKKLNVKLSAPPLVNDADLFLGTADKRILKVSPVDGQIMQQSETLAPPTVIIENTDKNKLIVGDRKGNLLLMSKESNKKTKTIEWRVRIGAEISSATITGEGLLISSFDNFIYLISEDDGKLFWKKRFSGRIIAAPLIANDYFIVGATDESNAYVAELKSGRSLNKISLEDDNFFSGSSMIAANLLIYSTLKGVLGFSSGGGCEINGKPEEQKNVRQNTAPF